MGRCDRCGDDATQESFAYQQGSGYQYCSDCWSTFEEIQENGVRATWKANRAGMAQEIYEVTYSGEVEVYADSQVEALEACLRLMGENDCRGLFEYSKSGSRWLVSEYLDAHPEIAQDVNPKQSRGIISRLIG